MSAATDVFAWQDVYVKPLLRYANSLEDPILSAWIRESANRLDEHLPAWTGLNWELDHHPVDDPPPPGWKNREWQRQTIEHHYKRPLQLAGVIPS